MNVSLILLIKNVNNTLDFYGFVQIQQIFIILPLFRAQFKMSISTKKIKKGG